MYYRYQFRRRDNGPRHGGTNLPRNDFRENNPRGILVNGRQTNRNTAQPSARSVPVQTSQPTQPAARSDNVDAPGRATVENNEPQLVRASQLTVRVEGRDVPIDEWRKHVEELNRNRTFPHPIYHCSNRPKPAEENPAPRPTSAAGRFIAGGRMAAFGLSLVARRMRERAIETREANERARQVLQRLQAFAEQHELERIQAKNAASAEESKASTTPLLSTSKTDETNEQAIELTTFEDENGNPKAT